MGNLLAYISTYFRNKYVDNEKEYTYPGFKVKEVLSTNKLFVPTIFKSWGYPSIASNSHFLVNGYANAWYIEPQDIQGSKDYDIVVEYLPQRYTYLGLFVSLTTLFLSFFYLFYMLIKKSLLHIYEKKLSKNL